MIVKACVRFHTESAEHKDYIYKPNKIYDIPCHRHGDAFYIISQFFMPGIIDRNKTETGFLTEGGLFLDRKQAMDEAIRCGQLPLTAKERCAELYSEDLW